MRAVLSTPILLLFSTTIGYVLCRVAGVEPHLKEAGFADAVALLATIAATMPFLLSRGADQAAMAQFGLVATSVHLLVAIVLAGIVILVIRLGQPFIYWLFAAYGMTLIAVATESVRLVKAAPPAKAAGKH